MSVRKLLEVCDFQGGTQPPKDEWVNDPREGYVRMLQIRDYSQGDEKFIQYVKDTKKLHKCQKDDIMLSRYGYIGQAFMGLEGAYNVALVKVIKKEKIHTPYLLYYFQSYYFQHFLLSNVGARATIPGFNKDELVNALIRIPEMQEQIEIASKISKVDDLISYHNEQIKVFDDLVKSRFIELFGAADCRISTFGNEFNFISRGKSPSYVECSNLAVINQACIYWDTINYGKVKFNDTAYCGDRILQDGDVLINSTGTGTLGRANVFNGTGGSLRYMADSHVTIVRGSDTCNPVYIKCFLEQAKTQEDIYRLCVSGSTNQIELSKEKFRQLKLPVPSLELQEHFSAFVEQIDKSKFEIQQSLEKLEILKKSLMQQYFG